MGRQSMDGENDKLKIVEFKQKPKDKPAIDSGLVSFLEELLQDAKDGQLNQVAIAYVGKGEDEAMGIRHIKCETIYIKSSALLGQVCLLKDHVMRYLYDDSVTIEEDE